jgi:hypothetical protein
MFQHAMMANTSQQMKEQKMAVLGVIARFKSELHHMNTQRRGL